MGSVFGRYFQVTTFGESHGPAVGVVVDGLPAGLELDPAMIQHDLDRRRPGASKFVSARKEPDRVEILSGLVENRTSGGPVTLLIRNLDVRSRDYDQIKDVFRPGHADFTYFQKYGLRPQPGGGRASGRETVGRVAAGALARALIRTRGMSVAAYTVAVAGLQAGRVDLDFARAHPLRFADPDLAVEAEGLVLAARKEGDSVGGIVEVVAWGVPAGLGAPVFYKLDAVLGMALLSIGGVKGLEFGEGFRLAEKRGSEANDQMTAQGFLSNRAGGVLGGISTGQPIVIRLAVKPTPSIARPQQTLDVEGRERTIVIEGRHDPCLCPRIVPVAEAMTALTLADAFLEQRARTGETARGAAAGTLVRSASGTTV
ncbi:MAG: chorismate synthase [Thermodesulfobacteriota bacterium]